VNNYFQTIAQLIEYELWCNFQAIKFLEQLTPEELERDFGFGLRTPHHTMFHIVNVMRTWSLQVKPELQKTTPLPYNKNSSLHDIRLLLEEVGTAWLLAARASHDLAVLDQVFHLVTHGTHHRGQLLSMATLLGYKQPLEGGDFGGWSNTTDEEKNAEV
jgi:uncharacterized damage-inducible protein DinB